MNKSTPYQFHNLLHSADLIKEYLEQKLAPFYINQHLSRIIKSPALQVTLTLEFIFTAAKMTPQLISLGIINCEKNPANSKRNLVNLTAKDIKIRDDTSEA